MTASLPKYLPYWATRTIDTPGRSLPVFVMKDGTVCCALEITGVDIYSSDDVVLNSTSGAIREALNLLPANGYLQTVFQSGFSWRSVVRDFYGEVESVDPVMREARFRRAEMLASDSSLTRTRIVYYVGLRQALGDLMSHRAPRRSFFRGGQKKHPADLRARALLRAGIELEALTTRLSAALADAGIGARLFSEHELLVEAFRSVSPRSAKLYPPPRLVETREDAETAKPGAQAMFRGPGLSSQLAVGSLVNGARHIELDEPRSYVRALAMERYPLATDPSWLFPVQFRHLPGVPLTVSITHCATSRELRKEELERKRNYLQSQMGRTKIDHEAQAAYAEFEQLLSQLAASDTRVFDTSVLALVHTDDEDLLEEATREVRAGFAAAQGVASTLENHQLTGWLAGLPGNGFSYRRSYPIVSETASHLTPYFQPSVGSEAPDLLFTNRQRGLRRLSLRQTGGRDNSNMFILGATGSGKTFLFSHLAKLTLSFGGHVVIADTKGPVNSSYRPIAELLGGDYVALNSLAGDFSFNPCPMLSSARTNDGKWSEAIEYLRDIICMMTVRDFDTNSDRDLFRRVAMDAVVATYERLSNPDATPILSDVVASLDGFKADDDALAPVAKHIALRLRLWCEDQRRGSLLNQRSRSRSDNPLQVFDFFGLDDDPELASVLVSALNSRIFEKLQTLRLSVPKLFHFDEAWALLGNSELGADMIRRGYRVARSYGGVFSVASQSHRDVSGPTAAAMMSNASLYFLLRANAEHDDAAQVFGLSERELELYKGLMFRPGEFAEFLYVDKHSNRSDVLRYCPTPYELWIDTSRAIDMELRSLVFARLKDSAEALRYLADNYPSGATTAALNHERQLSDTHEKTA